MLLRRRRPVRDCACLAVNGVGKPGAGEPHARFDRGRWRSGSHGEPEGCTHRETGGIEPGRLPLADQPAAYLTRSATCLFGLTDIHQEPSPERCDQRT
jgi:hypothetical protein